MISNFGRYFSLSLSVFVFLCEVPPVFQSHPASRASLSLSSTPPPGRGREGVCRSDPRPAGLPLSLACAESCGAWSVERERERVRHVPSGGDRTASPVPWITVVGGGGQRVNPVRGTKKGFEAYRETRQKADGVFEGTWQTLERERLKRTHTVKGKRRLKDEETEKDRGTVWQETDERK